MCDKRDRAITYVFFGDLHLTYCFLVFYKKTCKRKVKFCRKNFKQNFCPACHVMFPSRAIRVQLVCNYAPY